LECLDVEWEMIHGEDSMLLRIGFALRTLRGRMEEILV
jgi:hypothetical protein